MMSDKLDWTQNVGDAVLAQQPDVMDSIQRLRSRANANGKLESTSQQTVTVQSQGSKDYVVIEPASPTEIYVPYYQPAVVYGSWPYPAYPPLYFAPPPGYVTASALAAGVAFGAGVAAGYAVWGHCNWAGHNINVLSNRSVNINNFNRNTANFTNWEHNPDHRHGVRYNNDAVRQKYARTDAQAGGKCARISAAGTASACSILTAGRTRENAGPTPATGGPESAIVLATAPITASGSARRSAASGRTAARRRVLVPIAARVPVRARVRSISTIQAGLRRRIPSADGRVTPVAAPLGTAAGAAAAAEPAGQLAIFEAIMTLTFAGIAAGRFAIVRRSGLGLWLLAAVWLCVMVPAAGAQQLFQTPEDAGKALAEAAKSGDVRAIMRVLGTEGADLASSGDPVADAATRKRFLQSYEAKHRITMDGADKAMLMIGEGDWPFPIPLVRRNEIWRFDAAAGRQEILQRRIGRNELSAIQACRAYVDAQEEYADKDRTGTGVGVYAQRIVSRPGKKDGLYWPAQAGGASPLGELVARASAEGYRIGAGRQPRFMATTTRS